MKITEWCKHRALYSINGKIAAMAAHAAVFWLHGVPTELRSAITEELEDQARRATLRAHTARKRCEKIVDDLDKQGRGEETTPYGNREAQSAQYRCWTSEDTEDESERVPGAMP